MLVNYYYVCIRKLQKLLREAYLESGARKNLQNPEFSGFGKCACAPFVCLTKPYVITRAIADTVAEPPRAAIFHARTQYAARLHR